LHRAILDTYVVRNALRSANGATPERSVVARIYCWTDTSVQS
jgi:hypothetical protein